MNYVIADIPDDETDKYWDVRIEILIEKAIGFSCAEQLYRTCHLELRMNMLVIFIDHWIRADCVYALSK